MKEKNKIFMRDTKHNITALLVSLLVGVGCLFFALKTINASSIKAYKPDQIPFEYDIEQIGDKLLGGIEARAGVTIVVDVNCYDPDDDPFVVELISPPEGMFMQGHAHDPNDPNDFSEWKIYWTPVAQQQQGLFYIHLKATDIPPDGNTAKSDEGTLIYFINPENRPPELKPIRIDM